MPAATTTGDGGKPKQGRRSEHDSRGKKKITADQQDKEEEGEEEELFSQARDTNDGEPIEVTPKTVSDQSIDSRAALSSSVASPGGTDPSADNADIAHPLSPASVLHEEEYSSGSLWGATGKEAVKEEEQEEEEEEWCLGHVCLRLRPDGLRERRSGNSTVRRELEDNAGEGSQDGGSETDPDSVGSTSEGEVR